MIHLLNEGNRELRHRKFALPDGIRKHLQNVLNSYNGDKTANGYQRLTNILKMDGIMYNEMKRIKNFFDNYKGSDKSSEYVLNGGEPMKLWVDNTLYTATKAIRDYKQAKKDAGDKNAFIRHHEKDRQEKKNKPTQIKFHTNDTGSSIADNTFMRYEGKNSETSLNENDITKYIPKKVYSAIQKLNDAVQQQKQYTGDEYCLMEHDGYEYSLSPIIINEDEYKEYIKHYKSDLKRYLKYFQEYGTKESDYEEDGENRVLNRINNENKKRITVIITEKQLREIQKNHKY